MTNVHLITKEGKGLEKDWISSETYEKNSSQLIEFATNLAVIPILLMRRQYQFYFLVNL